MAGTLSTFKDLVRNLPVTFQEVGKGDFGQRRGYLVGNLQAETLVFGGFEGVSLRTGQKLVVRMVLDRQALGFQTEIQAVLEGPDSLLYAGTFPKEVETLNLRKTERIPPWSSPAPQAP